MRENREQKQAKSARSTPILVPLNNHRQSLKLTCNRKEKELMENNNGGDGE